MAEIHVQAKKQSSNTAWLWIVVVLLIIGALAYYLITRNNNTQTVPVTSPGTAAEFQSKQRPPRPAQVKIIVPIVHMRSV